MKYLNLSESYKTHEDKYGVSYSFEISGDIFDVFFEKKPDYWERSYKKRSKEDYWNLVNKNAFAITGVVYEITKEFIEEYSPSKIVIKHIGSKKLNKDELNSRAKLNFRYLKNLNGYNLSYVNSGTDTILTLVKN